MPDNNSLLQAGETLGPAVQASANSDSSSLLQPGETLGSAVSAPKQPGVLSRFASGVGQSLENNIVKPIKGIVAPPQDHKELVVSMVGGGPALTAYRASKALVDSAEGIIKAPKENFVRAMSDFQRGVQDFHKKDYRNTASDVASTAADVMGVGGEGQILGPRFRELSEGARPGGDLATPLGRDITDAATLAAGEYGPGIMGKVAGEGHDFLVGRLTPEESAAEPAAGKFQPAANVTPEEVLNHAQQEGVDVTPGQAIKSRPRQAIQGLGERAFIGGQGLEDQIQASRQSLTKSVSDFADRVDPQKTGTSEETAGDELQKAAQKAKDTSHAEAQAAYRTLPDELMNAKVDLSEIRQKWAEAKQAEQAALRNLPQATASKLQEVFDLGANIGTPMPDGTVARAVSFSDAQKMRSAFRDMGETAGADLPARYQGLFRNLASDTDAAMTQTADANGFLDQWRDANAGWKNYAETFGDRQSPLYRILNQSDPAKITRDVLNRGSAADIDLLHKTGVDLSGLKRQVVTDIANAGYRIGREGLAGYSDSFLNSLFGPVAKREIYLKSELGRRLGFEVNPSGTSNVLAAEMQIPASKEGVIKGIGGSLGAAKLSKTRPAKTYLPRAAGPSGSPTVQAVATGAVAAGASEPTHVYDPATGQITPITK